MQQTFCRVIRVYHLSDLVKNHREKNTKVDINSSIFHVTGKHNLQFQHTGSLLVFKADCVL